MNIIKVLYEIYKSFHTYISLVAYTFEHILVDLNTSFLITFGKRFLDLEQQMTMFHHIGQLVKLTATKSMLFSGSRAVVDVKMLKLYVSWLRHKPN